MQFLSQNTSTKYPKKKLKKKDNKKTITMLQKILYFQHAKTKERKEK